MPSKTWTLIRKAALSRRELYQTLNTNEEEIRILEILPSVRSNSPIVCRLITFSLKSVSAPEFEALSYVWGSPRFDQRIVVNERETYITPNLYHALRRVRLRSVPRRLWVDQLCINQSNQAERSDQVLLMSQIYSKAKNVLCWLGEPLSKSVEAEVMRMCSLLLCLRKNKSFTRLYLTHCPPKPRAIARRMVYLLALCYPSDAMRLQIKKFQHRQIRILAAGVVEFEKNPYWTRVWILQEFALAQHPPLLLYGSRTLKPQFLDALAWARKDGGLLSEIMRPLQEMMDNPISRLVERSETLEITDVLSKVRQSDRFYYGSGLHMGIRQHLHSDSMTMSWLVINTYQLRASDVRDRAYALYSMVPPTYKLPKPSYDTPHDVVLRDITAHILTADSIMNIYDWISPSPVDHGCPSWTPNFRDQEECHRRWIYCWLRAFNFGLEPFDASGGMPATVAFSDDGCELVVEGFEVDEVAFTADLPKNWNDMCPGLVRNFLSRLQISYINVLDDNIKYLALGRNGMRFQERESPLSRVFRDILDANGKEESNTESTSVGGASETEKHNLENVADSKEEYMHVRSSTIPEFHKEQNRGLCADNDADARDKMMVVWNRCEQLEGSTLFATASGYFGFTYHKHGVQKGDMVAIVGGMDLPHLLRPQNEAFRMVGSAYVSGIMDGDFVQNLRDDANRGYQGLRKFTIT